MTEPRRAAGSFRDPSGYVFDHGSRIFRTVRAHAAREYEYVRSTGLLKQMEAAGWLLPAQEVDPSVLPLADDGVRYVLEHPRLAFVSYPYEWPFSALQRAALLHLDLHLKSLEHGVTLSDASAYNIQFRGSQPVFIDLLSLRRYREGEFWLGHRQFCEQFLNPLLLQALLGVPYQGWYRGNLEGIAAASMDKLLRLRHRLSPRVLFHVVLPARLQAAADRRAGVERDVRRRSLPLQTFRAMLRGLRRWIAGLKPRTPRRTTWSEYVRERSYTGAEAEAKSDLVCEFARASRPRVLWDLGCNVGEYSEAALRAGAGDVIGFDADVLALEAALQRASAANLAFLPLVSDMANPSPDQGWAQGERLGLARRGPADALLALAFVHHLAIARNVPLPDLLAWLTALAPIGLVEFVRKDDPTVQRMLALREDIFGEYDQAGFEEALGRVARIVRRTVVSASGRILYQFDRS